MMTQKLGVTLWNVARSDEQADSVRAGRLESGASTWTGP